MRNFPLVVCHFALAFFIYLHYYINLFMNYETFLFIDVILCSFDF